MNLVLDCTLSVLVSKTAGCSTNIWEKIVRRFIRTVSKMVGGKQDENFSYRYVHTSKHVGESKQSYARTEEKQTHREHSVGQGKACCTA